MQTCANREVHFFGIVVVYRWMVCECFFFFFWTVVAATAQNIGTHSENETKQNVKRIRRKRSAWQRTNNNNNNDDDRKASR